jgi:4-aminobutyrate aminotransferase-like enzyme
VVAAIQKQAAELIHISGTDFYYESLVTFAERLSAIAPMPARTVSTTATRARRRSSAR